MTALAFSGCAATAEPVEPRAPSQAAAQAQALVELMRPEVIAAESRAEAINKLMHAELLGQIGEDAAAARLYTEVALAFPDVQVLARATLINMYAGALDDAVSTARRWFEVSDHDAAAIAALTGVLLRAGRLDEARESLASWIESDKTAEEDVFGQIGQFMGHNLPPETALEFAEDLLDRYPDSLAAQVTVARLALTLNHPELAEEATARATVLDPKRKDVIRLRVIALSELGALDRLIETLERARDAFPEDEGFRSALVEAHVQSGDQASALAEVERIVAEHPEDYRMLRIAALLSLRLEDHDAARGYLERLAKSHEHADESRIFMGRILLEDGEPAQARNQFRRVGSGEYWAEAQIRLAESLVDEGRIDEALEHLERQAGETADVGDAQRLAIIQSMFLVEAGRHEEAFDFLSDALMVWPDSPDFRQQRALVAERLDRLDVVESDLRYILERNPDDPDALNALGYTLADRTERHEEALELIERAVEIDGDNPAYIDSLGWVYFRLGRLEEAIEQLQRAFELQPDPEIGAHLGEAYWTAGELQAARDVWDQSLELDDDHHVLRATLKRLAPDMLGSSR